MDSKLSAIIQYKLPEYVQSEHEVFVAFIKSYYELQEEEGNWLHYLERYQRNLDVDRADDDFLDQYLKEFATTFPKVTKIPSNQLLKLMREFYLTKGSEDSFRFIFTILYGVEIDILYPRELMYVPSSGDYASDIKCNITGNNWFKLNIDNDDLNASIVGATSDATAVIDSITSTYIDGQQILQMDISSHRGAFLPNEEVVLTVDDTEVSETMYGSVDQITVVDGGTNYKIDDVIDIVDAGTGQRAKAKISTIVHGELTEVTISNAGTGYVVGDLIKAENVLESNGYGFQAHVYEVGGSGEIVRVRVTAGGYEYSKTTTGKIKTSGGTGAVLDINGNDIGKIKTITVTDGGIDYSNVGTISINITSDEGFGADLTPVLNGIFSAPKQYRNSKSMPSGYSKIMDSYYYQQFSYVIGSSVSPHEWLGQVKRIAHPAGTQLFGMYQLRSFFEVVITLPPVTVSTISFMLNLVSEGIIDIPLTVDPIRVLIRSMDTNCQLGLTMSHLDEMKFYVAFDYTIGDFLDQSISDIEGNCTELLEKQDGSDITIT